MIDLLALTQCTLAWALVWALAWTLRQSGQLKKRVLMGGVPPIIPPPTGPRVEGGAGHSRGVGDLDGARSSVGEGPPWSRVPARRADGGRDETGGRCDLVGFRADLARGGARSEPGRVWSQTERVGCADRTPTQQILYHVSRVGVIELGTVRVRVSVRI